MSARTAFPAANPRILRRRSTSTFVSERPKYGTDTVSALRNPVGAPSQYSVNMYSVGDGNGDGDGDGDSDGNGNDDGDDDCVKMYELKEEINNEFPEIDQTCRHKMYDSVAGLVGKGFVRLMGQTFTDDEKAAVHQIPDSRMKAIVKTVMNDMTFQDTIARDMADILYCHTGN